MAEDIAAAARTPTADGTDTRHNRHSRFPEGFVTAVLVDIPDHGPRIEIVNCGHPPPLLLRGRDVRVLDPREPGLPLGLGNLGDAVRSPDTAEFHIGDTLLLYTDGLVEARDPAGAFYPLQERIRAGGWARLAPDELVETIRGDLERHVRRRLSDDVAIAAIQRADEDGNPATEAEADWMTEHPTTPPYPAYASNASAIGAACATVLTDVFGPDVSFRINWSQGARTYDNFWAAADEMANSRIYGGIHFRFDCVAGQEIGRDVADYVLDNYLRPRDDGDDELVAATAAPAPVTEALRI